MNLGDVKTACARPAVQAAGLLLLAFAYHASYASHGNIVPDEAWLLDTTMRTLDGQVMYRDFSNIYAPARYLVLAAVFALTDGSLIAERLVWCLCGAGVVALVFAIGRRMMPAGLALAAAVTAMVLPGPWHKTLYALVPLLGLYPVARWLETDRRGWLVAAGLAGSVGAWFRQDVGAFVLATAGSLILVAAAGRVRGGGEAAGQGGGRTLYRGLHGRAMLRRAVGDALALSLPALAVFAAGLLALAAVGAAGDFVDQAIVQSIAEGRPRGQLLMQALGLHISGFSPLAGGVVALLCWVPPLLAVPALVSAGRRALAGRLGVAGGLLWCVGLCGLAACNQVLRRDVLIRFLQCAPFVLLLWFSVGAGLLRRAGRLAAGRTRALRRAAALAAVLVPPAALAAGVIGGAGLRKLPVEYTGSIATLLKRDRPFQVRGGTYYFSPGAAANTGRMLAFLEQRTRPGEPFLVLGQPAGLYYITGRISPIPAVRVSDDVVQALGPARVYRAALGSGLRYVIAEHRFVRGRGRLWQQFLGAHGRVLQSDDTHAIWEIGS